MTKREETAIHEAGHVVVGRELGCTPLSVTLDENGDSGHVHFADLYGRATLEQISLNLAITLAGFVATDIAEGLECRDLSLLKGVLLLEASSGQIMTLANHRDAVVAVLRKHGDYDCASAASLAADRWLDDALPAAAAHATRLLEQRWSEVTSLADRLAAKGHIAFERPTPKPPVHRSASLRARTGTYSHPKRSRRP